MEHTRNKTELTLKPSALPKISRSFVARALEAERLKLVLHLTDVGLDGFIESFGQ